MIIEVLSACEKRQCPLAQDISDDVTGLVKRAYAAGYYAGATGEQPELSLEDAAWVRGRPQPLTTA